jgi:DNA-binding transcriptional LysR family regulator
VAVSRSSQDLPAVLRASWWYHLDPQGVAFLRDYSAANPGVQVSLSESASPEALDLLRSGELDIALLVFSDRLDLTGIEHRVLWTEPCVLVTHVDHPHASRGSVRIEELAGEPFIVPRRGTSARLCFEDALVGHVAPPIVAETNEVGAMLDLVSAGVGSAVVTASIATRFGAPVGVVRIEGAPHLVLAVAWATGPHSAAVESAIDLLFGEADR